MVLVLKAGVRLEPGCKLYYDCPLGGEDYRSEEFFRSHKGKIAKFIRYDEDLIGILDFRGRVAGRYLNIGAIWVRFDGEEERCLNAMHFVVLEAAQAELIDLNYAPMRLGELPHPILFYPGDLVQILDEKRFPTEGLHEVASIFIGDERFAPGGVPRYCVLETALEQEARVRTEDEKNNALPPGQRTFRHYYADQKSSNQSGVDLVLAQRGMVWALYNEPEKLKFATDSEEAVFWSTSGISNSVSNEELVRHLHISSLMLIAHHGHTIDEAYELFDAGVADIVIPQQRGPKEDQRFSSHVLFPQFSHHRERVRMVTKRLRSEYVALAAKAA